MAAICLVLSTSEKVHPRVGERSVGVIRFLAYPRGRRDVGQALLTQAEDWLRKRGRKAVIVFPQAYRYPFYAFPHAFISNNLEHVQALLLFNGYQASQRRSLPGLAGLRADAASGGSCDRLRDCG